MPRGIPNSGTRSKRIDHEVGVPETPMMKWIHARIVELKERETVERKRSKTFAVLLGLAQRHGLTRADVHKIANMLPPTRATRGRPKKIEKAKKAKHHEVQRSAVANGGAADRPARVPRAVVRAVAEGRQGMSNGRG
ncbi:MAG TPA: hypothetical protein VK630_04205 [Reyranella sp.]|nr:hypothetical protein [Reyranella sp.]